MSKVDVGELTRNWNLVVGRDQSIDLTTLGPRTDAALLRAGDRNSDGQLTLAEAWHYIQTQSAAPDPSIWQRLATLNLFTRTPAENAEAFTAALSGLFSERAGRPIRAGEHSALPAEVLYLQFNDTRRTETQEERDVRRYVGEDRDRPTLHQLNMSTDFNSLDYDGFQERFTRQLTGYLKRLVSEGKDLSGLVISGHSNGEYMLQELTIDGQHGYVAKLNVREQLWNLRNASPEIRAAFDRTEYVVIQACFHGDAVAEWARIFPNAVIVGTRNFSPSQDRVESGLMARAAISAATILERGGAADEATRAGFQGLPRNLTATRELVIDTPDRRAARARENLDRAQERYDAVAERMDKFVDDFNRVFAEGNPPDAAAVVRQMTANGWRPAEFRELYVVANTYYLARRSVWALDNIVDGQPMPLLPDEITNLAALRDALFAMRMHAGV